MLASQKFLRSDVLSIVFIFRQTVKSTSKFQTFISRSGLRTHPSVYITNIKFCASKKNCLGVCKKGIVKDVLTAMLITLLLIWRMTPSSSKSLFRLVAAEYQSSHHCTIHGTSMSLFRAPRIFIFPAIPSRNRKSTRDFPALVYIPY